MTADQGRGTEPGAGCQVACSEAEVVLVLEPEGRAEAEPRAAEGLRHIGRVVRENDDMVIP